MTVSVSQVRTCLDSVIDPESGLNIVDLGLVYHVDVSETGIRVHMTLTTPGCPMAKMTLANVEQTLRERFPDTRIDIKLAWDPPWSPDRMSDFAKEHLGYDR